MKYLLLHIVFLFLTGTSLFAQGELETLREPDKYFLNSYGLKINSNGYGAYYSYSTRINYRNRRFIEAEYNYLKSPKEIKVINPYFGNLSPGKFVFGKTHTVHNLKVGYGLNKMIFEKRDKNSISIHLSLSAGPILAFSKPIYYEIVDSVKIINNDVVAFASPYKIDINIQNNPTDILGKAPFTMGLNEIKIHPGIYVKFGLSFDFSQDVMKTRIIETGAIFDTYFVPIEIMAGINNNNFLYLYLSYHFGKKYDARLHRDFRRDQRKNERKFE